MKKLNEKLSEVLDVEPIQFEVIESKEPTPVETLPATVVDDDASFARCNIRTLIEKGNQVLQKKFTNNNVKTLHSLSGLIINKILKYILILNNQ